MHNGKRSQDGLLTVKGFLVLLTILHSLRLLEDPRRHHTGKINRHSALEGGNLCTAIIVDLYSFGVGVMLPEGEKVCTWVQM